MHSRRSGRCGYETFSRRARRGRSFLIHRGCRLLAGGSGVLRSRLNRTRDQFLVPTALALPKRKNRVRIGTLIYGSRRRNDLATATWARTAARGASLDIDYTQKLVLVVHDCLSLAGFAMSKSNNKDGAKDRNGRHEQHEHADIEVSYKVCVVR